MPHPRQIFVHFLVSGSMDLGSRKLFSRSFSLRDSNTAQMKRAESLSAATVPEAGVCAGSGTEVAAELRRDKRGIVGWGESTTMMHVQGVTYRHELWYMLCSVNLCGFQTRDAGEG